MNAARLILLIGALIFASLMWDLALLDRIILALIVLLVIAWSWNKTSLSGIGIRRSIMLDRVNVGDPIIEEITLSNASRLPKLWVELEDMSTLPDHFLGEVVSLRGRGSATWRVETTAVRRGKYRLGPNAVSASDPVGLFSSRQHLPVTHHVIVFPARIDVSAIPLPTAALSGGRMMPRTTMVSTPTVSSVRDYAPGDPMNRIAWGATARRGELMVKEFDPDPTADLWLLLDLSDDGQFDLHFRERVPGVYRHLNTTVEYIVSIGATLANNALEQGRKVGVIVNREDPIRLDPDNSERQWFRIAEMLSVVTSAGSRSISQSLTADHRRFSRSSGLIVVSADPGSDWVAAAASLVERLVPVTAVLVDAGGEGQDDIEPLSRRLATARVHVHRYLTHRAV